MSGLKKRSRWLAVVFVFFTVVGAAMAIFGDGADRIYGLISIFLFGFGGVAVYVPKGQKSGGALNTSVIHDGRSRSALVFEMDRRRQRVAALGALGMGAAGGLMAIFARDLSESGDRYSSGVLLVAGVLMAVVLGSVGIMGIVRWNRSSQVALLEEGLILDIGARRIVVPWDSIEGVGVLTMQSNHMLGIALGDRKALQMGFIARALMPLNRKVSSADLAYPLESFVVEGETVVATIQHYLANSELRGELSSGRARPVRELPLVPDGTPAER